LLDKGLIFALAHATAPMDRPGGQGLMQIRERDR
jgi:hypothetical protein